MNFGFVTNILKTVGTAVLPVAEEAGVAAANAALPGLGGTLAQIAITGITQAIQKHGTAPASTPSTVSPGLTTGQAKLLDVMQMFENAGPDIANAILAGRNKVVIDRAGFVSGTQEIVEGFLAVMKSIGAIPSTTPPTDPMVITPTVIAIAKASTPAAPITPVPVPAGVTGGATAPAQPLTGVIQNLATPATSDIVTTLEGLLAKLKV